MSYQHLVHQLYSQNVLKGIKLGLENTLRLDQLLGYPSKSFPSIHIAGTNGKGSVATKIAKAYQSQGLKVGLYTSPHISCFRERIRVNEIMISEQAIELELPHIFSLMEKHHIPATFFETTTLLAFAYFATQSVDIAVIETGLGGRLDATNILLPQLAVITSISLDHTEILGNSIECITKEKAGIIKPKIPLVIGPTVPRQIIEEVAKKNNSPCYSITGHFASFEEENRAIAKKSLEILHIPQEAITKGVEATPPCRMETLSFHSHTIILDVAHNPEGISNLLKSIKNKFPEKPLRVICGFSKSKDVTTCLKLLLPHTVHFYPIEAPNDRALPLKDLYSQFNSLEITQVSTSFSIPDAIQKALNDSTPNHEILLICGSFFIMSQARKFFGIIDPCDVLDIN